MVCAGARARAQVSMPRLQSCCAVNKARARLAHSTTTIGWIPDRLNPRELRASTPLLVAECGEKRRYRVRCVASPDGCWIAAQGLFARNCAGSFPSLPLFFLRPDSAATAIRKLGRWRRRQTTCGNASSAGVNPPAQSTRSISSISSARVEEPLLLMRLTVNGLRGGGRRGDCGLRRASLPWAIGR